MIPSSNFSGNTRNELKRPSTFQLCLIINCGISNALKSVESRLWTWASLLIGSFPASIKRKEPAGTAFVSNILFPSILLWNFFRLPLIIPCRFLIWPIAKRFAKFFFSFNIRTKIKSLRPPHIKADHTSGSVAASFKKTWLISCGSMTIKYS